jgi:hypothetical protein
VKCGQRVPEFGVAPGKPEPEPKPDPVEHREEPAAPTAPEPAPVGAEPPEDAGDAQVQADKDAAAREGTFGARAAGLASWGALGLLALLFVLFHHSLHASHVSDPDKAAEAFASCTQVKTQGQTVFGTTGDGKTYMAALRPELVRALGRKGVGVKPQPDYPGWLPVIILALLAAGLGAWWLRYRPAMDRRAAAVRVAMILTVVCVIFSANWDQGAHIDASPGGIQRRAVARTVGQPFSFRIDKETGEVVNLTLQENMRREAAMTGLVWGRWIGLFSVWRWAFGLLVLWFLLKRVGAALEKGQPRARTWLAVFFGLNLTIPLIMAAIREGAEPALSYWIVFGLAVWLCWRACHAMSPAPAPRRTRGGAVAAALILISACLLGGNGYAQEARDEKEEPLRWGHVELKPGDIINYAAQAGSKRGSGGRSHTALYLGRDDCGQPRFFDFFPATAWRKKGSNYWDRIVTETRLLETTNYYDHLEFWVIRLKDATIDRDILFEESKKLAGRWYLIDLETRTPAGKWHRPKLSLDVCTTTVAKILSRASNKPFRQPTLVQALNPVVFETDPKRFDVITEKPVTRETVGEGAEKRKKEWEKGASDACRNGAGIPPSTPGGVALGSLLDVPPELEKVQGVVFSDGRIRLVAGGTSYAVEGVSPGEFVTILRSVVLLGKVPILSIGTQPSWRPGYARVSYYGPIRNTSVGLAMANADIKFKAAILGLGSGPECRRVPEVDELLHKFPGHGGEWMRLWIVGSKVKLAARGGAEPRVFAEDYGLRVRGETTLRGAPWVDGEMKKFTESLSARWDVLSANHKEFRALEPLVLATAISMWIRSRGIPISPEVWEVSPSYRASPDYVPVVLAVGAEGEVRVCGGVTLAPESRFTGPGQAIIDRIHRASAASSAGGKLLRWLMALAMLAGPFILPALLIWWLVNRAAAPEERAGFRRCAGAWAVTLGTVTLALTLTSPLLAGSWFTNFDSELIRFLIVFVAPLFLLGYFGRRFIGTGAWKALRKTRSYAVIWLMAACTYIFVSCFSVALAVTTSMAAPRDRKAVWALVTVEQSAWDSISGLFTSYDRAAGRMRPVPRSLMRAQFHPLSISGGNVRQPGEMLRQNLQDANPFLPWTKLTEIRLPPGSYALQGWRFYSVKGKPPY